MKKYTIVVTTWYGDTRREYTAGEFSTLKEARGFLKERCYVTTTRTYSIRKNF